MEFLHPILGPALTGEVDLVATRSALVLFEGGYMLEDPFKFAAEGRPERAALEKLLAEGVQCVQQEDGTVVFRLPDKTSAVRGQHVFCLMPWDRLSCNWPSNTASPPSPSRIPAACTGRRNSPGWRRKPASNP